VGADPKPRSRHRDRAAGSAKVMWERQCRTCGAVNGLTPHHVVPRSHGGDDVHDNFVPLCLTCHDALHHDHATLRIDVRRRLLIGLTLEERAYASGRMGPAWLDHFYGEGEA
jgi:HNH endonuclease